MHPSLSCSYAVVNGERTDIDLGSMPVGGRLGCVLTRVKTLAFRFCCRLSLLSPSSSTCPLAPLLQQSLTPRQVQLLASAQQHGGGAGYGYGRGYGPEAVCNSGGTGTLREIDPPYSFNSREQAQRERAKADTCVGSGGCAAGGP